MGKVWQYIVAFLAGVASIALVLYFRARPSAARKYADRVQQAAEKRTEEAREQIGKLDETMEVRNAQIRELESSIQAERDVLQAQFKTAGLPATEVARRLSRIRL